MNEERIIQQDNNRIKSLYRKRGSRNYAMLFVVFGLAAIVGVLYASRYQFIGQNTVTENFTAEQLISEIRIGALLTVEDIGKENPRITQKQTYETGEPLVMRITTGETVTKPLQLSVRLLTPVGQIVEMDPSSVTFKPGTTGFCCWQVAEEGTYTMQIFRPEKTISTIPLVIKKSLNPGGANLNLFK